MLDRLQKYWGPVVSLGLPLVVALGGWFYFRQLRFELLEFEVRTLRTDIKVLESRARDTDTVSGKLLRCEAELSVQRTSVAALVDAYGVCSRGRGFQDGIQVPERVSGKPDPGRSKKSKKQRGQR